MSSPVPVLNGLRVVEMSMWVAGPSAGGIMADWGADVVKVEPPVGDPQRNLFKAIGYRDDMPNPAFALDNRGKRSAVLDLRSDAGKAAMESLLAGADVFLTNMRPAALRRLGLHPEEVHERFPRLVVATVSGYGLDGPEAHRPGYDIGAFWARGGIARHLVAQAMRRRSACAPAWAITSPGISTVSGILGAAITSASRTGKGTGRRDVAPCARARTRSAAISAFSSSSGELNRRRRAIRTRWHWSIATRPATASGSG